MQALSIFVGHPFFLQ